MPRSKIAVSVKQNTDSCIADLLQRADFQDKTSDDFFVVKTLTVNSVSKEELYLNKSKNELALIEAMHDTPRSNLMWAMGKGKILVLAISQDNATTPISLDELSENVSQLYGPLFSIGPVIQCIVGGYHADSDLFNQQTLKELENKNGTKAVGYHPFIVFTLLVHSYMQGQIDLLTQTVKEQFALRGVKESEVRNLIHHWIFDDKSWVSKTQISPHEAHARLSTLLSVLEKNPGKSIEELKKDEQWKSCGVTDEFARELKRGKLRLENKDKSIIEKTKSALSEYEKSLSSSEKKESAYHPGLLRSSSGDSKRLVKELQEIIDDQISSDLIKENSILQRLAQSKGATLKEILTDCGLIDDKGAAITRNCDSSASTVNIR